MIDPIKLTICVPTAGKVHVVTAYSIAGMIARISGGVRTRPDTALEIGFDFQASSVLTSNRELLVKRAVDSGKTHLMFIDDDMGFEPQVVEMLLGHRQPVVATNYLIKKQAGEDPTFVAVDLFGRRIATTKESTGLQEISYSGFGVSLFETRVFKAVPQPWFAMEFVPSASCYTTEDNPFFARVREAGFPCYLDHDASKLVTHNGDHIWKWDQWTPPKKVVPELKIAE